MPTTMGQLIEKLQAVGTLSTGGWLKTDVLRMASGFCAVTAIFLVDGTVTALTKMKRSLHTVLNLVNRIVTTIPANSLKMRYLWLE
jgi:hypothetical protein